jgi:hypothetical protein
MTRSSRSGRGMRSCGSLDSRRSRCFGGRGGDGRRKF